MQVSCRYCGRMHDEGNVCELKPKKEFGQIERFRNSGAWINKRQQIKKRDNYCCVCCVNGVHDVGRRKYDTDDIEIHHIIPLRVNFDLRLSDDNLISLCRPHHELAERGVIKADELRTLISPPGCSG